jgi:hypothetical protein
METDLVVWGGAPYGSDHFLDREMEKRDYYKACRDYRRLREVDQRSHALSWST